MKNIYVGNLSYSVTEDKLKDAFGEFGEVTAVKIITDKFTGKPRGFAFVEMSSDSDAQKAIAELNGADLDGRNLKVNEARPRESRPPRHF